VYKHLLPYWHGIKILMELQGLLRDQHNLTTCPKATSSQGRCLMACLTLTPNCGSAAVTTVPTPPPSRFQSTDHSFCSRTRSPTTARRLKVGEDPQIHNPVNCMKLFSLLNRDCCSGFSLLVQLRRDQLFKTGRLTSVRS
jgi:hypothetical protein